MLVLDARWCVQCRWMEIISATVFRMCWKVPCTGWLNYCKWNKCIDLQYLKLVGKFFRNYGVHISFHSCFAIFHSLHRVVKLLYINVSDIFKVFTMYQKVYHSPCCMHNFALVNYSIFFFFLHRITKLLYMNKNNRFIFTIFRMNWKAHHNPCCTQDFFFLVCFV